MSKQAVKMTKLQIAALEEELAGCTTEAMRKCVRESLEAARARLAKAG